MGIEQHKQQAKGRGRRKDSDGVKPALGVESLNGAAGGAQSENIRLTAFARQVHAAENAILEKREQVGPGLGDFVANFMAPSNFGNLQTGMLVDHALWRILAAGPEERETAIALASFLNPQLTLPQTQLVAVLGRFARRDPAVKEFLEELAAGGGMGLIMLNKSAVDRARQILERDDEPRNPPSQQDDLRML